MNKRILDRIREHLETPNIDKVSVEVLGDRVAITSHIKLEELGAFEVTDELFDSQGERIPYDPAFVSAQSAAKRAPDLREVLLDTDPEEDLQ